MEKVIGIIGCLICIGITIKMYLQIRSLESDNKLLSDCNIELQEKLDKLNFDKKKEDLENENNN